MLHAVHWISISLVSSFCLPVFTDGNKRDEKPSRWMLQVDDDDTLETKHQDIEKTLIFTYTSQHNKSCDCQRNVLHNVSFGNYYALRVPETPLELYSKHAEMDLLDSFGPNFSRPKSLELRRRSLVGLKMKLGEVDKRGAFLVVSESNQMICDDHFSDLMARTICLLHGYKAGRRTSTTVSHHPRALITDRESMLMVKSEDQIGGRWQNWTSIKSGSNANFDEHRYKCFSNFLSRTSPGGRDRPRLNLAAPENCVEMEENSIPCAKNQAAAVFCHDNDKPFLHFYNIALSRGVLKFYITFKARYVKFGRVYEYFEDTVKSAHVMPKRSDFSARMCGKKVGLDFQTTREMNQGRHLVILGKFLKKCDQCVQIKFKNVSLFGDDDFICKLTARQPESKSKKKKKNTEKSIIHSHRVITDHQ